MNKVIPGLCFNDNAEVAVNYYVNTFRNSKIDHIVYLSSHMAEMSGLKEGSVSALYFEIEGQTMFANNAGPMFTFTPGISLMVPVDNQQYLDEIWARLSAGGQELQGGWVIDQFGVTWQVSFTQLHEMFRDKNQDKVDRVMSALFQTPKLNLAALQKAYAG